MAGFRWQKALFLLLLISCSRQGDPLPSLPALPASYAGKLPCPDCPGIQLTLTLWPDSTFYLQQTRLDGSEDEQQTEFFLGAWGWPGDGRLELLSDGPLPGFRLDSAGARLFPLDHTGQPDPSSGRSFLVHGKDLEPLEPRLDLVGMVARTEEGFVLRECLGGRRFLVIPGGDSPALEAAWAEASPKPDEELLVQCTARLGLSPAGEEERRPVLYIENVLGLTPDEDCPGGEE